MVLSLSENDAFFHKDHVLDDVTYRIFSHRLSSYSDFLLPSALESRGIMFSIKKNGEPNKLVSRPTEKFFNYLENPFTEDVDFSKTKRVMTKEDGSLVSTFLHKSKVRLKSKGSLESEQAVDSTEWLYQSDLLETFNNMNLELFTIDMEWTAPHNRIVLGYEEAGLIILGMRNNETGERLDVHEIIGELSPEFDSRIVVDHSEAIDDVGAYVALIPQMEGIEGFVLRLEDGQQLKIKTEWYLSRHRAKDSINNPKALFKAIIGQDIDDIMVLFHDDEVALKIIRDMQELVIPKFNHMIVTVEKFYENNKHLDRKEYAIKAQGLNDRLMSLYMNLYIGRDNDYTVFSQKNYDMFIGEE